MSALDGDPAGEGAWGEGSGFHFGAMKKEEEVARETGAK